MLSSAEIGIVLAVSIVTAVAALAFALAKGRVRRPVDHVPVEPLALLFDNGLLHHANDIAMARFALWPGTHIWEDLREKLIERFPDFPDAPGSGEDGSIHLRSKGGPTPGRVDVRWRGPLCWVLLDETKAKDLEGVSGVDSDEVEALRRSSDTSPHPVWHLDKNGSVIWSNAAYRDLQSKQAAGLKNGSSPLFPVTYESCRVSMARTGSSKSDWFEVTSSDVGDVTVNHATCINALVDAEDAQRTFVQTLAKTFAHLSIGLAIFDRNGQLVLFNPALLDLTGLRAEFLSAQPKMLSFFDQLRENRRMPEPKNYRNWRQEITEVINAATDGRYHETWPLEDGRTYAVQGRPHPDGALAFLIEDISAEVSLTRNFRAELELSQTILDSVDEGLVVFSASGILTFCNAIYKDLWRQNPDAAFADVTLTDCLDIWKDRANSNMPWQSFLTYLGDQSSTGPFEAMLSLDAQTEMACTVQKIGQGSILIRFKQLQNAAIVDA